MSQALFTAAMPTTGSAVRQTANLKNMSSNRMSATPMCVKKYGAVPINTQRSAVVMSATPDKNMGVSQAKSI